MQTIHQPVPDLAPRVADMDLGAITIVPNHIEAPLHLPTIVRQIGELVAIPSTEHNPDALKSALDHVAGLLRPDITVEWFESNGKPSFLAYKGAKRPDKFSVILNGHADVVPDTYNQYRLIEQGNRLIGRGTYDMKAAIIVMADLFNKHVDQVEGLGLQVVSDEEKGGHNGTKRQIEQGVCAEFAIMGEAGRAPNQLQIANEAKGIVIAYAHLNAPSHHGSKPWTDINAISGIAKFISGVHDLYPIPEEETFDSTITFTKVESVGGSLTQTPHSVFTRMDARYKRGDPVFADAQSFTEMIKGVDPDIRLEFELFEDHMYADPDSPYLQMLKAAAERTTEGPWELVARHGTGDGRFYTAVGGAACEFGIGGFGHHGPNEYVTIPELRRFHTTLHNFLGSVAARQQKH